MRESYLFVCCERRETMQSFPCSSVLSGIHLASSLALHLFYVHSHKDHKIVHSTRIKDLLS